MWEKRFAVPLVGWFLLFAAVRPLVADSLVLESRPPGEVWAVTTRMNYRVRRDGRYLGHADREYREVYRRGGQQAEGYAVTGTVRVVGGTKKDGIPVAARLETTESVEYVVGIDGSVSEAGEGFPRLRGFPTFTREAVRPGDVWEAPIGVLLEGPWGERVVIPQVASYRYIGTDIYRGEPVHVVEIQYAVRYRGGVPAADEFVSRLEGGHRVNLVLNREDFRPIMARDSLKETWIWADGTREEREGFALTFWDGIPPMDRSGLRRELKNRLLPGATTVPADSSPTESPPTGTPPVGGSGIPAGSEEPRVVLPDSDLAEITIRDLPEGVSLTLRNLHFLPDQAVILPEDRPILDELAEALRSIPGRTVVVRGHTADIGNPTGQKTLSEERARVVADALSARGIDPRRLIYEGVGGEEPEASNETEEGRRINRRVELIILED